MTWNWENVRLGIPSVIHGARRMRMRSCGDWMGAPLTMEDRSKIAHGIWTRDWVTFMCSTLRNQLLVQEFLWWIRCFCLFISSTNIMFCVIYSVCALHIAYVGSIQNMVNDMIWLVSIQVACKNHFAYFSWQASHKDVMKLLTFEYSVPNFISFFHLF